MTRTSRIRALGEIALRVNDLDGMQSFYEKVVGLDLMKRFPNSAFFRIAEGFEGHTQILALFDRSGDAAYASADSKLTTLDHLAFTISKQDYTSEKERLNSLGLNVMTDQHDWVKWRSIYVYDPEGNLVE